MSVPARAGLPGLGEEHPRRDTGEPDALAREVRLVRVAGADGEHSESLVGRRAAPGIRPAPGPRVALSDRQLNQRQEALEPQHPVQRLRAEDLRCRADPADEFGGTVRDAPVGVRRGVLADPLDPDLGGELAQRRDGRPLDVALHLTHYAAPGLFKRAGRIRRYGPAMSLSTNATVQGRLWSSDPQGWAETAEGRIRPLYERVLDRLDLRPGVRLLDVGCGAGLFAELAARRGADVTGLDAAPGLVEYARRRRPGARYVVEDLEHMPFDSGAFDVVTAFNSVLYAAYPRRALAEIRRVTTAAGRAVVTVGAGPEQAESAALINPLAPPGEVPGHAAFDLADPDAARGALIEAGFASVVADDIAFDVDFRDEHDAIAAQLPAGPVIAAIRHSGRAAVEAALHSFFAPRMRADGTARLGLVFRCYLAGPALPVGGAASAADRNVIAQRRAASPVVRDR
jgi:SAM-dependent methyltransferase